MSNIQFSINRIKNSKLNLEPFPHLIVDNFLPQEDYEDLVKSLKNIEFFKDDNKKINRSTFMVYHKGKQFLKEDPFKKYIEFLSDPEFQDIVIEKMKPTRYNKHFVDLWIQADCYRNEFKFPIHCDSRDKFLTFVLYTPTFDGLDKSLGTRVYNKKKKLVDVVEYLPNRVIIFPPSTYSWHNMEGDTDIIRNSVQAWYLSNDKRKLAPKIRRGFNSS